MTGKWNILNDQSHANYDVGNEVIYNTEVLKSNLCDCNDAYILIRGETQVAFKKNCAPFINVSQKLMEQQQMILKI